MLGALRGWAQAKSAGRVTAAEIAQYAGSAMQALLKDRTQTPEVQGDPTLAFSAGQEAGPDMAAMALRAAPRRGSGISFSVSALPDVPKANMPSLSPADGVPSAQMPGDIGQAQGIDFGSVDVDALGQYDEAVRFDKGDASPESKAAMWRALGKRVKTYADLSEKRAAQWDDYAAQAAFNAVLENDKGDASPEGKQAKWENLAEKYPQFRQTADQRVEEWKRYAVELSAAQAAREKRDELMDRDWDKLSKLLSFSVVSAADKTKFAQTFVSAYGRTSKDDPYVEELQKYRGISR